jgi:HEAT repeat protein
VQKIPVLKKRKFAGKRTRQAVRLAESHLPKVREFVWNFSTAFDAVKSSPALTPQAADALSALDRTLRSILALAPALAINEHDGALVVNGTLLTTKVVGQGGPELVKLLVTLKLRGFVMLSDISHQELTRFVERIARLGPKDLEADKDPGQEISSDGSFPNVLVGEAMFKMAQAALGPITKEGEALEGDGEETAPKDDPKSDKAVEDREDEAVPGLPPGFTWPSDATAKRARELVKLEPAAVVGTKKGELLDVTELLLLDGRDALARRLWEHYAIAFTAADAAVRKAATEIFIDVSRRGTAELRTRFYRIGVRRIADALEVETNVDLFELLTKAVRAVVLERIGDGDFDTASRLTWSLARRREGSGVAASQDLLKISQEVLREILRDPRAERLFETIETGSVADRRRAARVLEGMGTIAVPAIVDALKRTGRGRVETFLIDLLAGLVPESEQAILREVTPYAPPEAVKRLLRAASVACRDATQVLVIALQNPDPQVRVEAVSVARSVGGHVAQSVLKWAVKHGAVEAQLAAVTGLGELARGDAADSVLELLENAGTVEVQRECALALGKLQAERAVPMLAKLLRPGSLLRKEEHEDVRHAAAWSLGQMRQNDEARKALERALEDKNKNVRLAAKAFLEGRA